jgi:formylglycine-generating enzyme required for sulfatase activity
MKTRVRVGLLLFTIGSSLWAQDSARRNAPAAVSVRVAATGMEFVKIQPGEFMMGCSAGDKECLDLEKPSHGVRITKAFEIGRYEVTQDQWQAVMGSNPSVFTGSNLPVDYVSWNQVQDFLQKLNAKQDGYRYRLPTEAEWEYAARAGTTGARAGPLDSMAWYVSNSGGRTHAIGQKQPNAWGLYDVIGNVWEWVQDWYDETFYARSPAADPVGPSSGRYRVLRGGSWYNDTGVGRVSYRFRYDPTSTDVTIGFRCVREVERR